MAAAAAALALGIEPPVIEGALAASRGCRIDSNWWAKKHGVAYVDDSKGTNVGAVVEALAACARRSILIAGGVDKGGDYAPLRAPLASESEIADSDRRGARQDERGARRHDRDRDVLRRWRRRCAGGAAAQPGDTVLLSPACSSFDQFKDYAERGRIFQELVRAL